METKNDIAIEAAVTEKDKQPPTTEKKKRVRKPKASPAAENEEAAKVETEVIVAKKLQDSVEHTDAADTFNDTVSDDEFSNSEDESTAARLRDMIEDQLVADIPEEKEEEFVFDDEFLDIPENKELPFV
jgi:hypothetical protein